MSDNLLKKEFKTRDVQRMRNIITKKTGDKTGVQVGYTADYIEHKEGDVWEENGKKWTIKNGMRFDAEDACICLGYGQYLKDTHKIKFADANLANMFSTEWCNPTGNSLGFHGLWNTPLFFDEKTVIDLVKDVRSSYWYSDRLEFFRDLCNRKRYFDAKMVVVNKLRGDL